MSNSTDLCRETQDSVSVQRTTVEPDDHRGIHLGLMAGRARSAQKTLLSSLKEPLERVRQRLDCPGMRGMLPCPRTTSCT
jgi:hypothetical protein